MYVAAVAEAVMTEETFGPLVDAASVRVVFFKGDLKKPILTFKTTASVSSVVVNLFFGVSTK